MDLELIYLKSFFNEWLTRMKESWQPFLEEKKVIKKHEKKLDEKLEAAFQEWLEAKNYFDNVTDPVLIDHASYLLQAAERKYVFYLKKSGIKDNERLKAVINKINN
ncbi:MAG: DUF2508 family protein [Halothermotrichaceae bacterium]